MASAAAFFRTSGAAKSGKPCDRLIALCSIARRVISRITDSVNCAALDEMGLLNIFNYLRCDHARNGSADFEAVGLDRMFQRAGKKIERIASECRSGANRAYCITANRNISKIKLRIR